ncbi:MAG: MATE family efflux transporter [Erysipelotrichaceae bacterium]|nr:MATE family efflux transporter [Erysipelotrichaceae bacterium]
MRETNDILSGSILKNILKFVWPLMLANILQITFNFADVMVIGNFVSQHGLAAVGTTNPIIIFFTWGLYGLSMGANVLISRMIGARDHSRIKKAVFTGVLIGLIFGLGITVLGIVFARVMLQMLSTPADIIDDAVLYLRIYFLCGIAIGLYDFSSAILRASGDSKNPTIFLGISGVINVLLNMFFVIVLKMSVAGVAAATVISQTLAAFMSVGKLIREESIIHLEIRKENYDPQSFKDILSIGIPSALQNQLFSFSNMIIQTSLNSFGSTFVAANTAANAIEEYVYVFVDAFPQASLTFTSQMYGAKRYKDIKKLLIINLLLGGIGAFLIGLVIMLNGEYLLGLLSEEAEVISLGLIRLRYVTLFLFMNGLLDVVVNSIRGMGLSNLPTIITLFGVCGFRILYIYTFFQSHHTPEVLYLCFPLSWLITTIMQLIIWIQVYHRLIEEN